MTRFCRGGRALAPSPIPNKLGIGMPKRKAAAPEPAAEATPAAADAPPAKKKRASALKAAQKKLSDATVKLRAPGLQTAAKSQ